MNYIDQTLDALAEPSRRAAIDLLSGGPKRAGELAEALGLSGPAASRHLRTLRRCGLVEVALDETDARGRVYSLRPDRFEQLSAWLEEVREFWAGQLASFKEHAEQVARSEDSSRHDRTGAPLRPATGARKGKARR